LPKIAIPTKMKTEMTTMKMAPWNMAIRKAISQDATVPTPRATEPAPAAPPTVWTTVL
jgi:hypothetical protein